MKDGGQRKAWLRKEHVETVDLIHHSLTVPLSTLFLSQIIKIPYVLWSTKVLLFINLTTIKFQIALRDHLILEELIPLTFTQSIYS